ncbi:Coenzyme Q-binding protein coq10 [Escovopsis weberi]|uniref:Coenzyme Q-binding protein coq10 n=1 Tax=Escovopsis weberi TaxID=150374 RepID=A0A0M9VT36_ESCWE|nr:Coenzyme Q-binding protein coq10 [Escovopsis weberi]
MSLRAATTQRILPRPSPPPAAAALRILPQAAAAAPRRAFISLPDPPPQHLSATRVLPYPHQPLYDLIADVDSYSSFVPYCSHSRVTQWSAPDQDGRASPVLADLHIGWGGFNEVFTSRLRCVPGVSVEALSGSGSGATGGPAHGVFRTLETLWSLRPLVGRESERPATEVRLAIKFQFANPLYAAVSAAVSDQMASIMIEAFETRVHRKLRQRL